MQLNEQQKYKVLFYAEEGLSSREIASKMAISKTSVNNLIKKHKDTGSVKHKRGNGRPKLVSPVISALIKTEIKVNPMTSLRRLKAVVREKSEKTISHATIMRHLNSKNLFLFSPIKKPLLSKNNISKRKEVSRRIIKMSEEEVKTIIFSDECKFNLFYSDGRQNVWREPGTGLESRHLIKTVKHGGGSVMVWACFSYKGRRAFFRQP